jgi:hypothetical protein
MQSVEPAQFATVGEVNGVLKIADTAALCPGLVNPPVPVDAVRQRLYLTNRQTAWFLTVNIFTGLGSEQRTQGVPMIACGNQHGVNFGTAQQFPKIPVQRAILVPVVFIGHPFDPLAPAALHVANRDELDVLFRQHHTEVVLAAWTKPNSCKNDPLTRGDPAIAAQDTTGNDQWDCQTRSSQERVFEEITPGLLLTVPDCLHANCFAG